MRPYQLKELSALEVLECMELAAGLEKELQAEGVDPEVVRVICEHCALGYLAVYEEGKRRFSSPRAAAEGLTLEELAELAEEYEFRYGGHGAGHGVQIGEEWEAGLNESFSEQVRRYEGI